MTRSAAQHRVAHHAQSRAVARHTFRWLTRGRRNPQLGAEVGIDGFMACFAEARRVAHDFWSEAEFFVSDLLVGCVLDATLVTLLAAPAKLGAASPRAAALARGGHFAPLFAVAAELPASLFAAAPPGVRYTAAQRAFGFALKSLQFGAAGAACGLVGQAMANTAASARAAMRRTRDPQYAHDAHTLIMPPLARTALVWGLFMGASAHTRLQVVVAIERIVESLPVSQRVAALPMAVSLIIRTANNIIGGEQFVDLAAWGALPRCVASCFRTRLCAHSAVLHCAVLTRSLARAAGVQ